MVSSSKAFYGDYLKYQIGRLFYARMGQLLPVLKGEETLNYSGWFSDPEVAASYTMAQHNGSLATAKALFRRVSLDHVQRMLDVGGGSGAFSVTAVQRVPSLFATVLELPAVCAEGRRLTAAAGPAAARVEFRALDATEPTRWPVEEASQDLVLMSYLCGSIPEEALLPLYRNAFGALRPGGRLVVHDFMVEDSKDGPALGAYWALQHVTVNPQGLGLTPSGVAERLAAAGFEVLEQSDLIARMTKADGMGWDGSTDDPDCADGSDGPPILSLHGDVDLGFLYNPIRAFLLWRYLAVHHPIDCDWYAKVDSDTFLNLWALLQRLDTYFNGTQLHYLGSLKPAQPSVEESFPFAVNSIVISGALLRKARTWLSLCFHDVIARRHQTVQPLTALEPGASPLGAYQEE
ncbi:unnamed protein product [Durusdinium trenchii]|uniref:O-methyltransferase C-terminal domain-containing protein n=1 Tax=Durusdinium trenchii TaxID=1381693 RepID=A0ABP0NVP9_9DINO